MADLKLKKVILRNWGKFERAELDFPESGLVMVTGLNISSGGAMQSVGSGKTILGESFSRALLGVQGRFEHLKQFSRDRQGDAYVCVEADLLGKPLKVEMGFQCEEINPRGEGLRFSYDGGKPIERGRIAETRAELVKLIGVPPLLASWTVFVNGKHMDFTRLAQEQSVELVMSALRQPPWTAYHERVKAYVHKFNKTMTEDETTHKQAQLRLTEATEDATAAQTDVDNAQADYDEAKAAHDKEVADINTLLDRLTEQMEPLQKRQQLLDKEMKKLEESKASAHHELEIRQRSIQESIRKLKQAAEPLLEVANNAQRVATVAETNYTNYRDAKRVCPTCNQPLTNVAFDANHLAGLESKYNSATKTVQQAESGYEAMTAKLEDRATSLEEINEAITCLGVKYGITTMSEEFEENEERLQRLSAQYGQKELRLAALEKGPADNALNAAKTKLTERNRVAHNAKESLKIAAEGLALAQTTERVLNYWNTAFSPYGIPNMVLREAIAPLNHEARRISASMTGGTIEVVYGTTRELATGATKAQLNISVNNLLGSQDLAGSSMGEAGLTNYIISETLSNIGQVSRRIGYRWYDEIVPHQDTKVCHSIYSYWKELAQKLGILILMVDHNPVAANYADHFLTVEKRGKPGHVVGTVYWK